MPFRLFTVSAMLALAGCAAAERAVLYPSSQPQVRGTPTARQDCAFRDGQLIFTGRDAEGMPLYRCIQTRNRYRD